MNTSKILIFLPAKNEATTVASVISDTRKVLTEKNIPADFLVIDDGSNDTTSNEARAARAKVIRHEVSRGLGTNFREATEYAREYEYDILVTIDADKQFSESEILLLLEPILDNKADFVTGSRFLNGNMIEHLSSAKRWGNQWAARIISRIIEKKYHDVACGFRAYNKKALHHLHMTGSYTYTQEVFLNLGVKGLRILEVPITVRYFPDRKSRIAHNLFRYGKRMLVTIIKCVVIYRPMKLFGLLATLCFAVGIPILLIDGIGYLATSFVPYKSLGIASLILVILGTMFLTTGLLLQIISRMQLTIEETLFHARKK